MESDGSAKSGSKPSTSSQKVESKARVSSGKNEPIGTSQTAHELDRPGPSSSELASTSTSPPFDLFDDTELPTSTTKAMASSATKQTLKHPSDQPDKEAYYERIQRIDNDVYLACDKLTKSNFYAIKLFHLDKLDEVDFKLLIHDIQICKQLRHPNILQYLTNFIHEDQLWITAPLCSFTSADRLSKPFGLPELAIAFIIRDTLNALDYLHRNSLIHRSVRASHLLINSNGRCLLSGFKYSITSINDGKRQPFMHQYPSKARPNINWFSPEILEQNLFGYNHKSDIYSLGITCCELANGVVPFSDLQPTEMLLDKLTGNAPRLLDQTCQELVNLRPNEMNARDRDKFFAFRSRQFSNSFHAFTSGLCLNFDPQKRPDAKKLLSHNFIKQLKRSPASSLLDFLDPALQVMPKSGCDSARQQQKQQQQPKQQQKQQQQQSTKPQQPQKQQLRKQESGTTTPSDTSSAGSSRVNIGISQKKPLL